MKPRIGATLVSTADDTTVVVIRWGPFDLELTCGGALMVHQADRSAARPAALDAARAAGTHAGWLYHDDAHGVELLCTTAGWGDLAIGDEPLEMRTPACHRTRPPPDALDIFHQYGSRAVPGVR